MVSGGPLGIIKTDDPCNIDTPSSEYSSVRGTTRGVAVRVLNQFVKALAARGEVTFRVADLGHRDGLTHFPTNTVYIDHRLGLRRIIGTIAHELTHLVRGEVDDPRDEAAEELQVRRETADLLIPAAPVLRAIPRQWTAAELDYAARAAGVDVPTIRDAVRTPCEPVPAQRRHLHVVGAESVA